MKKNIILTCILTAIFAGSSYASQKNMRNPPSDCDPDVEDCECPTDESGANNGCVQVTLALGKTSVLSDQRRVQLKIFTSAASPSLSTPEMLHVVMGYTFQHLGSASTAAGAPSTVDFVHHTGEKLQFAFAEGSSLGIPNPGLHKDLPERLQMVDANGWATLTEPVYYDLYPGDGSVWRFMATDLTGQLGKLISFTDPRGRVLTNDDFGVDIVRAPNGLLRQVLTPSTLADIVTRGPTGYTVTVYPLTDADVPVFADGLYALPPHAATEVLTVDRGDDFRHLIVTLKKGGATALSYDYAYINGDWTLTYPDGRVEQKEIYYGDDEETAMMVKFIKDSAGHVYSRRENLYMFRSWGYAMTNRVDGFGSATRNTSWTFVPSGAAMGKVSEKKDSTGAWTQYGYDANGRTISVTDPNRNEVVTTSYNPVDPADPVLLNDLRPRTIVRTINAIEVERTYYAYTTNRQEIVERCATQGAAYGSPANLRTVTTWYPATDDDYSAGRVQSVRYEDGQMDVYTYSWINSIWTETVTRVHEQEPDPVAMQTTRRLSIFSRVGNRIEERTELMTAPGVWEQIDGTVYAYTVAGKESKRTTFNGLVTTSEWAGTCCGKSSETAPDGTRTTFTYDDNGRLIVRTVLDPNPIEMHVAYDAIGRQIATFTTNRVAQLGTAVQRTTYDALSRVVSRTDELGNATTTAYSADERTFTITNPYGATQTTVTDASGRPISVSGTGVAPRTYAYGVNTDGSQWTQVYQGPDATAAAWRKFTENLLGRTIREEKPGFGNTLLTTTYTHDNGGRVLAQTQADATDPVNPVILSKNLSQYGLYGHQTFTALDVNHNGIIDFAGPDRVTAHTSTYIAKNNALWQESTQTVYPDFDSDRAVTTAKSRRKLTNLGAFASVSESEDIRGNISTSTQAVDRNTGVAIASSIVPTSVQPQVQLQQYGQLVESISTSAITNRFAYDGLNRRVAVTDGRGNTSTMAYNTLGQVAYTEDAATNRTAFTYDQWGLQVESLDALNQSTFSVYDLRGNVIKQHGATYPVWYEYDSHGRMVAMATTRDTDLDPATVDSLDHPSLDVTRWNYDPATGLLTQKLYDDGKGPSYTYTPDGKLATRTWARGVVTEYEYNVAGELESIQYSDETLPVLKTYNRLGSPVEIISSGTTNTFAYSATTLEKISDNQFGNAIRYGNDNLGRMETLTITNLYDGAYAYNALGRMATATFEGLDFNYSYLSGSDLVEGLSYGSVEKTVSYETFRDLVTGISYHNTNGVLIAERKYAYNGVGNVLSRTRQRDVEPVESDVFGHNVRSELIAASLGGTNAVSGDYDYTYDPIGNRTVATNRSEITAYTANELNQYTNIVSGAEFTPEFDDDGNQTKVKTSTGIWSVQYNAENRPVVWTNATGTVVEMEYDHMGRRLHKTVSDTNGVQSDLRFLYASYLQIAAIETNAITTTFWDPTEATATRPLAMKNSGAVFTYTHDLTKNIMEVLNLTGTQVVAYDYEIFGAMTASTSFVNRFGFSSEYYDTELGCVYYNYRHYNLLDGRWGARDTVDEKGGINLYGFLANRHLKSVDLIGLFLFGESKNLCARKLFFAEGQDLVSITPEDNRRLGDVDGVLEGPDENGVCYFYKIIDCFQFTVTCQDEGKGPINEPKIESKNPAHGTLLDGIAFLCACGTDGEKGQQKQNQDGGWKDARGTVKPKNLEKIGCKSYSTSAPPLQP